MTNLFALSARFLLVALLVSVSTAMSAVNANSVPIARALSALSIMLDEVSLQTAEPIAAHKPVSECDGPIDAIKLSPLATVVVTDSANRSGAWSGEIYAAP